MRGALRYLISSLVVGALSIGLAWAGSGLVPVNSENPVQDVGGGVSTKAQGQGAASGGPVTVLPGEAPPPGYVLAGASKISIEPRPEDFGGTWETDRAKCATLSENFFTQLPGSGAHLATAGSPWPENPNCIYMGGFGIGPMNPVTGWDEEFGLWVRTLAVKGSNGKTLLTTIVDGEGWLWDYANKCERCGAKQIGEDMASELGVDKEGIVIAATHAHSAPDFIGGWGFVPDWYMTQVTETIKDSMREAVASMKLAVLETGEALARPYNSERRDTYRSAEEQQVVWLRAMEVEGNSGHPNQGNPKTIATMGAFAAHPTTKGTNDGIAHADWPATFEKEVEDRFGGIGLYFMTGLGNMSASGGTSMGKQLAQLIPERLGGIRLDDTRIAAAQTTWNQPATNVPLTALGVPGFFDREFQEMPAEVRTGKNPSTAPCASASASSVELPSSVTRIGNLFALSAAPGEIFSNVSNTLKEQSKAVVTMPLGQANDALGYMPQSFELNPIGQQGLGFVAGGVVIVNYEDSYAVDRCIGDKVLEETIGLFGVTHGMLNP